jgi:hypothetical protein
MLVFVIARRRSSAARLCILFVFFLAMPLRVSIICLGFHPPALPQHQPQQPVLPAVVMQHGRPLPRYNSFHRLGTTTIMSSRSSTTTCRACNHDPSDNNTRNSSGGQRHQQQLGQAAVFIDPAILVEESAVKSVLEPLDVVLARARKRPISPLVKLQAVLDARTVISGVLPWLTVGDALFCLAAMSMGAQGFAVGLFVGKWTSAVLLPRTIRQQLPPMLLQLYPVVLAILFDQWIS